jgi:uncharacterized protein YPO0396
MQLSVFSTDNQKSGFRLQYMEVFNWGTFDETVHKIEPMGETSLLTGANGSGKTTFVDALLTLIVPEKKYRFYNQSSGSEKKGDRTEDSYLLGGYSSVNSESTGADKTLYLRENKEEAYSILLANFANEADQTVTLFQVRYYNNGDMRKHFAIAHKPLHIETDFKPFDLGGEWKRALEQRYNKTGRKQVEWFDAASRYAQRLTEVLGMQSVQALQLFNQTVGIKVLGNLDEFIRTHMLEPRNIEAQFQELKTHMATLLDARRNIEKAEEQIGLLQPVQQQYALYQQHQQTATVLQQQLETARIWHAYTKNDLLHQALADTASALTQAAGKSDTIKENLDALRNEERQVLNQIDNNKAGQRLRQLEDDMKTVEKQRSAAEKEQQTFIDWCNALHLEENNPVDETAYQRIKKENDRKRLTLEREQRLNGDDEFDAKMALTNATKERQQTEEDLNAILNGKNNMPGQLIALRQQIGQALGIDTQQLPFVGEMMQVKAENMEWEPALEKLLRSVALRMLVPDRYYKKVNKYVNQQNLRARLVYEHVTEVLASQAIIPDTVAEKLDFHPDHKLGAWAEQHIIRRYDYACLPDEKDMERYEKAITLNGLVKNGLRHEKDDRPGRNDPTQFVMGWNNEKKKAALLQKRDELSATITQAEETVQRCEKKGKRLQAQFYANGRLHEHGGFDLLDVAGLQRQLHKMQAQVEGLRKDDKALDNLKRQAEQLRQQIDDTEKLQTDLIQDLYRMEQHRQQLQDEQQALQPLLLQLQETDKDSLIQFQQQHPHLLQAQQHDTIDAVYQQMRQQKEQQQQKAKEGVQQVGRFLEKAMRQVKYPASQLLEKYPDWLGDTQLLAEDAEYAAEYTEWLDKLMTDNLPRYKKDFERYINDTITYKIGGLNEELEKWERDISGSIQRLNQSLGGINFNRMPDTYIELRKQPVPAGSEAKVFRAKLLDALPQAANWQQSSFEEKALHFSQKVHPLIAQLDENESYRNKVMDVRNWFEFWAEERYRNTGESKKAYRQMGQLSGGEKAQLTYTILCSAIAYQFGITREGKNSRSLRFIAVDESFSNQDEEKATYLMELCKQLHLQLLVVTPSDKIQIVQDFIAHVHLVQRVNNRHSVLYNMTVKELKDKIDNATDLT